MLISNIGLPDGNGCDLMRRFQRTRRHFWNRDHGFGQEEDIARSKTRRLFHAPNETGRHRSVKRRLAGIFRLVATSRTQLRNLDGFKPSRSIDRTDRQSSVGQTVRPSPGGSRLFVLRLFNKALSTPVALRNLDGFKPSRSIGRPDRQSSAEQTARPSSRRASIVRSPALRTKCAPVPRRISIVRSPALRLSTKACPLLWACEILTALSRQINRQA
jgi:hypothetical protein